MQINNTTWFVPYNQKHLNCKHCNTKLKNQPMISKRQNKYCVLCAIILNIVLREELSKFGFNPPEKYLDKMIQRKIQRLSTRKIPLL